MQGSRRGGWWFGVGAGLLGLAIVLPLVAPSVLRSALEAEIRRRGVEPATIEQVRLGLGSLTLEGVRLGDGDLDIASVRVDFNLFDLVRLHWGDVRIEGARLRGQLARGLSFAALDALLERSASGEGLPFRSLVVEQTRAELDTPAGPLTAPLSLERINREGILGGEATLRVEDPEGRVQGRGHLTFEPGGRLEGRLSLSADSLPVADWRVGRLRAELHVSRERGSASRGSLEITAQRVELPAAWLEGAAVERLELVGTLHGADGAYQGDLSLDLTSAAQGLGVLSLDLESRLMARADGLSVESRGCSPLRIEPDPSWGRAVRPFEACLETSGRPLLDLRLPEAGDPRVRLQLALAPAPIEFEGSGEDGALLVSGESPRIQLDGEWVSGLTGIRGTLKADGGRLEWPAAGFSSAGLETRVELAGARREHELRLSGSLEVHELKDLREPARVVPLRLSVEVDSSGSEVGFRARLRDAPLQLVLRAEGTHDLASGSGTGAVAMRPLHFTPDGLQPAQLFPFLEGVVFEVEGHVSLGGSLTWGAEGAVSNVDLHVQGLDAITALADLDGIETAVHFDRLLPPSTSTSQRITIERFESGVELHDGQVDFRLSGDGVRIERASWQFAGGELAAETIYDPSGRASEALVYLEEVDLAQLVELLGRDDLEASGTVSGTIPLHLEGDTIVVRNAFLEGSAEGGVLHYRSGRASLPQLAYEELRMTLNGDLGDVLLLDVYVRGTDTNAADPRTIEVNLDLEVPADSLGGGLQLLSYASPAFFLHALGVP